MYLLRRDGVRPISRIKPQNSRLGEAEQRIIRVLDSAVDVRVVRFVYLPVPSRIRKAGTLRVMLIKFSRIRPMSHVGVVLIVPHEQYFGPFRAHRSFVLNDIGGDVGGCMIQKAIVPTDRHLNRSTNRGLNSLNGSWGSQERNVNRYGLTTEWEGRGMIEPSSYVLPSTGETRRG
jgi:hypothetical protein